MTEIGDAGAGNESHISRADHCNAHRSAPHMGRCRWSPPCADTAPISVLLRPTINKCLCVMINVTLS